MLTTTVDNIEHIESESLFGIAVVTLPPALRILMLSDQSVFVAGAIEGVVREAVIAGCLTAIMILLFLGD